MVTAIMCVHAGACRAPQRSDAPPPDAGSSSSSSSSGGGALSGGSTTAARPTGTSAPADTSGHVLPHRNDNGRSGAILSETQLDHQNVRAATFGQLRRLTVDSDVYAQPLFVKGLSIKGATRNVVYVATCHNSVYAFDADGQAGAQPLWKVTLAPSMPMTDFPNEYNFATEIGIVGTPVIDLGARALYCVTASRTIQGDKKTYSHQLHALDIATGTPLSNSPQTVTAAQAGQGAGATAGEVAFDSFTALQRTALLLEKGTLWFGTSAHAYSPIYHGWLFAYDAATLRQKGALNTTSSSAQGGIWMSGGGPSVDEDGAVFVTSGNGLNANPTRDQQQSLLKFTQVAQPLAASDKFTVSDWAVRDEKDQDFGSTSATMVPGSYVMVAGDKLGQLYAVDSRNMGQVQPNDTQLVAKIVGLGLGHGIYGAPVFWAGPAGARIFTWPAADTVKAYRVTTTTPVLAQADVGAAWTATAGMPGGVMSLSSRGTTPNTGILWAAVSLTGSASGKQQPGVLVALNAENLAETLYRSDDNAQRDTLGTLGKFAPPLVADGKVFVATQSNAVAVFGRLP